MESSSTLMIPPMDDAFSSLEFTPSKSILPDVTIKLASNNYLLWKAHVVPVLHGHGLLGYRKNKVPCPATRWLHIDQLVLGWLNSSLFDAPLSQVTSSKCSHNAWVALENLYGTHTRDHI